MKKSLVEIPTACTVVAIIAILSVTASALTWEQVTPAPTVKNLQFVTYGNGLYVAVGDSGTILTSPNGQNWTKRTSGITSRLWSVAYGNGLYVTLGDSGKILTSTNGVIWNGRSSGTTRNLFSVTYGNRLFVAVGDLSPGLADSEKIISSPNGITWSFTATGYTPPYQSDLYYVTNSNGLYIAFRDWIWAWVSAGTIAVDKCDILTSSDCKNWTTRWTVLLNGGVMNEYEFLNSVTYGNGRWVAVGVGFHGNLHNAISDAGITWDTGAGFRQELNSITYGSGQYVAVGGGGIIYTSPDGLIDTAVSISGTTSNLNSITYGNGLFVAVGNNGTILTSSTTAVKPEQKAPMLASSLNVQARNSHLTISLPSTMLGKNVDLAAYSASGRKIMKKMVRSDMEKFSVPCSLPYGSFILVANDGSRDAIIPFVNER